VTMPDRLLAFCVVAAVFSVSPGPDTLLVVNRALTHGRGVALMTALGSASGLVAWGLLSAVGIAGVLSTSATAFTILKLVGAAYLVLLGVRAIGRARHIAAEPAVPAGGDPPGSTGPRQAFRQGLLSNLLNAKAGVFFVAIVPQFMTVRDDALSATMVFAVVDAFASVAALSCYAAVALAAARLLRQPAARRAVDRLSGAVLIGLGAKIATAGTAH
jgi:threonine/homoserine/homoserine lactone efflux protein